MKRVKLFLTGLMMSLLLLTSCLDGESTPQVYDRFATVKTGGYGYNYLLTDGGETLYYNSNSSIAKDIDKCERVYLTFTINEESSEESNLKEGEYNINLESWCGLDKKINYTSKGASTDTLKVDPIKGIDAGFGVDGYLQIYVDYYLSNNTHSCVLFKI